MTMCVKLKADIRVLSQLLLKKHVKTHDKKKLDFVITYLQKFYINNILLSRLCSVNVIFLLLDH